MELVDANIVAEVVEDRGGAGLDPERGSLFERSGRLPRLVVRSATPRGPSYHQVPKRWAAPTPPSVDPIVRSSLVGGSSNKAWSSNGAGASRFMGSPAPAEPLVKTYGRLHATPRSIPREP
jgi:hypothetical protein